MRRALLLALALPTLGCLEDHLGVDITTEIRRDGSCHRRTVYTLERFDTAKPGDRLPIPPQDDPLRLLHRFPQGPPWSFRRELLDLQQVVTVEAELESPNLIGSDYYRARKPKVAPARNQVNFAMDASESGETYEYSEIFLDPASPLAAARQFARALVRRDDTFAREFTSRIEGPRPGDVKRVYRETFALPMLRAVLAASARGTFTLRERRELEGIFLKDRFEPELARALEALTPASDLGTVRKAVEASLEALTPSLESEMSASGLPMDALFPDLQETRSPIHFTARLVLPLPITRANTCFEGETAAWDFDGDDLYGRGFEMWAKAVRAPP